MCCCRPTGPAIQAATPAVVFFAGRFPDSPIRIRSGLTRPTLMPPGMPVARPASLTAAALARGFFVLAEPTAEGTDRLGGLTFEAGSKGGVSEDAFKALHALSSLRDRIKAGKTILIVAVPEDEKVAATDFDAGAERDENRPRLVLESDGGK